MRRNNRFKFIIINHRDQEKSSVILMRYKESSSYVQRQTDKLLKSFKHFAKAYVDNIIVFSRIMKKHLKHLETIFKLFREKRVSLASTKSILAYLSIILLRQRVNNLEMFIIMKKLTIITALRFFHTFKDLKIFLDLTKWLRFAISRYV